MSTTSPRRAGRKRDGARDAVILDAVLEVLAESGYDATTVDLIAERAGMARATVYRRWPTKAELVLAAVSRLGHEDVDREHLPDTGSLRGDMLAMTRPFDQAELQIRTRAVVGLLALANAEERLVDAAARAGIGFWVEVNRLLIQRAVDRGEYAPPADLDVLAEVIPLLCVARSVQRLPITVEFSRALIDGVVLPALRGGDRPPTT